MISTLDCSGGSQVTRKGCKACGVAQQTEVNLIVVKDEADVL